MTNVRALANLFCNQCAEITMHNAGRCIHCTLPNRQSGNPPVPKTSRQWGQRSPEGEQRRIEALRARHAARRARREALAKGRP